LVLALVLCGCGGPSTTRLIIDVSKTDSGALGSVTVTVFDPYGEIGHATVAPAPLPGQLVVSGLPERALSLRIAAVGLGAGQRMLGATQATLVPGQLVTASIVLAADTPDRDSDGVPDSIDWCPTLPDPHQLDSDGVPPGDACRNLPPSPQMTFDLGVPDLAPPPPPPPPDMRPPPDLAGTPPPPPPPDMARPISTCATAGVALCDGFEGKSLLPWWSTVIQSGGTATIDTTRAYRGQSSLHLHNNQLGTVASDVEIDETGVFFSHLYMRAFIWVPMAFDPSEADVFLVEQNNAPYQGITLNFLGGYYSTSDTLNGGGVMTSPTAIVPEQWVCVEWDVTLGSSSNHNGNSALTVDGTVAPGLSAAQSLYGNPTINQFGLALVGGPHTPARDLWIDELIVDKNPIGCAK
jgi:hypothetical protein